jgi:hypothetical protein
MGEVEDGRMRVEDGGKLEVVLSLTASYWGTPEVDNGISGTTFVSPLKRHVLWSGPL